MDALPPIIQILANEKIVDSSPEGLTRFFHKIIPELKSQAEWSTENYLYADHEDAQPSGKFVSAPVNGLDPLSNEGKCNALKCRVSEARGFAQTLGLYSDLIVLPDSLTAQVLYTEKWTQFDIYRFMVSVLVLQELRPLLGIGLIQFLNPSIAYCDSCFQKLSEEIRNATNSIIDDLWAEIGVERDGNEIRIDTGSLHEPSLITHGKIPKKYKRLAVTKENNERIARDLLSSNMFGEVHDALLSMNASSATGSVLFSNSRATLSTIREIDSSHLSKADREIWESKHSADLPWIKKLSVEQVVQLREEAASALPQFREVVAGSLGSAQVQGQMRMMNDEQGLEVIRHLRAQTEEVASELQAININGERMFHNLAGGLGISIAVYGFAADIATPAIALGTLLTTLGLIHTSSKRDEQDAKKVKSKPGYVLVKARDLLDHAK